MTNGLQHVAVVGDRMSEFGAHPQVAGASELARMLAARELVRGAVVVEGQGLHDEQLAELHATAASHGRRVVRGGDRVAASVVHKRCAENVAIGPPRRVDERRFELALLLDDRGELLADHLTGQHIQGMALIEAARQACIAVTEMFYTSGSPQPYQFVLGTISARFSSFVFPLPVAIRLELTEVSIDQKMRLSFHAVAQFQQAGQDAVTVEISYHMYDQRLIRKQEDIMAQRTLDAVLAGAPALESAP